MLFNDEVVVVTGGAQGIGREIVCMFFKEGARVVILDVNTEKGQACAKGLDPSSERVLYLPCDVAKVTDIEWAVNECILRFGRLDVVINNAGILHSTPLEDVTEDEWDHIMDINLKGAFFLSQKAIKVFKRQGGGKIVNVSSLAGRMGGYANGLAYTASKAALIGLTYGLARRVAADNVTVNAVAPGTTETDILKALDPERVAQLRQSIPLKRLGRPEDIASAVVFLASPKANFITGAVLDVNGGMFMG
jgi:NAD(P)-dependent dehydrogenase (short-subunit alcohol dehydrogenase family)